MVPGAEPPPRRARRGAARLAVYATYAGLALYFVWPVLSTGASLGIEDWDALLFQHAAVLKAIVGYAQPPFWNPWYCGGNVLWQNPQTPLFSPVYLLAGLMSLARAMKVTIALHYLIGLLGMDVLLRRACGVTSALWAIALASMFTFAGGAALHLAVGHATFLVYFYLPWLAWLTIAAIVQGSVRHALGAAAVLAVCIWNGGVYVGVMGAVAMSVVGATAAALTRSWRPAAMLALVGLFTALLSAPKLVPVLMFSADPHKVDVRFFPPGADRLTPTILMTSLFEPYQCRRLVIGSLRYGWHEYGNYFGPFGVFLILAAVVSVILDRRRRDWWLGASLAVATVFVLVAAIGDIGPLSPYALLRRLPGLSDLRISARYLLVFTLMGTALVGWTVGGRRTADTDTPAMRFFAVAVLLSTLFVAYRNRDLFLSSFPYPPLAEPLRYDRTPAPTLDPSTNGYGANSPVLHALASNHSVMQCNEPLQLAGDVIPARPLVFADGAATITDIDFTPNRVEFGVKSAGPARVFMNQRYMAGWTSTAGPMRIDPINHLAYVDVSPGVAGRYAFAFAPGGLVPGAIAWLIGLGGAVLLWRRAPATRWRI